MKYNCIVNTVANKSFHTYMLISNKNLKFIVTYKKIELQFFHLITINSIEFVVLGFMDFR